MADEYVRVGLVADVAPGTSKAVAVDGVALLLCNSKDRIFAVENRCSHAEEKLECGRVRAGWVACPVHGARFDLATGKPMNPPATLPIKTYEARVVDAWVEVKLA